MKWCFLRSKYKKKQEFLPAFLYLLLFLFFLSVEAVVLNPKYFLCAANSSLNF